MVCHLKEKVTPETVYFSKSPMGSFFRAHVTRPLVSLFMLTSRTSGQATKYDSKWRRAGLNFGPLLRGISVGSDAL